MELLTQRLASLLTVKSLVTVILTAVFAAMAGTGRVTTEQFLTVFTVVTAICPTSSGPAPETTMSAAVPSRCWLYRAPPTFWLCDAVR